MAEPKPKVIPTGIVSLDALIGGGFPAGSLVLLLGEIGAGHKEFAMSSGMMLGAMKQGLIKPAGPGVALPKETWWLTFTRSPADLLNEVSMSFDKDLYELFKKNVKFKDFSEDYFKLSPVPPEWVSEERVAERKAEKLAALEDAFAGIRRAVGAPTARPKTLLESLANFLTECAPNNLVVLCTLGDLARLYSDSEQKWYDFTLFLRGLQRAAKRWGGIIYADMTAKLLSPRMEEEIAACVDGVLSFEWERAGAIGRRRMMHFRKFRGLMPRLDGTAIVRFEVSVTPTSGFEVTRAELIEGLR
jgi:KaiC/GvpD/RAD55 family RecA-like ATPase